jgi:hypothetical protein
VRSRLLSLLNLTACLSLTAQAEVSNWVLDLLKIDVPRTDWQQDLNERIKAGEPLPDLPEEVVDAPDASPAEVLARWRKIAALSAGWIPPCRVEESTARLSTAPEPGPEVRQKLLEAVQVEPAAIPEVLEFLPRDEQSATVIHALYQALPGSTADQKNRQREVRAWIFLHSGLKHGEVVADAWQARWECYADNARRDPALYALQAREPQEFDSLLEILASHGDSGLAVVAARLLLEHSKAGEGDRWRNQLMWAALDPVLPEKARKIAVDSLLFSYWPGRDAWILSNLEMADLGEVLWYRQPAIDGRDHWIPTLIHSIGSGTSSARDHAVELLSEINRSGASPEILFAFLPWLEDAGWSKAPNSCRLALIESLGTSDVPECIPGLLQLLGEEGDEAAAAAAAKALVHYRGKTEVGNPVSLLRTALERCKSPANRKQVVGSLAAFDGYSKAEIASVLAAYFSAKSSDPSRDVIVDAGEYYASLPTTAVDCREEIEAKASELEKEQPELAERLRRFVAAQLPVEAEPFAQLLGTGAATSEQLEHAFVKLQEPEWKGDAFVALCSQPGEIGGFAAALTGDVSRVDSALSSEDTHTQAAILASARLLRKSLKLDRVAELLKSPNATVIAAAGEFLRDSRDPEARRLWAKCDASRDLSKRPYKDLADLSKVLQDRLGRSGGPDEVIALDGSVDSDGGDQIYVAVYPDLCLAVRDLRGNRIAASYVTPEQLGRLREFLARYRIDDLPSYESAGSQGTVYYYSHVSSQGIRTFAMSSPPRTRAEIQKLTGEKSVNEGVRIYAALTNFMLDLLPADQWKLSFPSGIEVIVSDDATPVESVWRINDELQVLGGKSPKHRWRVDSKKKALGAEITSADGILMADPSADLPADFQQAEEPGPLLWLIKAADATVRSGAFGRASGLWLCRQGREPDLIVSGHFARQLVSADDKWCVAVKTDGDPPKDSNVLVRINLETREVLALDPAFQGDPVAYLPARRKFLVSRLVPAAQGEASREYHLFDPVTGSVEPLEGDHHLFIAKGVRPPQATGARDETWAAVPTGSESAEAGTLVGRLNGQSLTFQPVWKVKDCRFESDAMWVDEKKEQLYACVEGDLVKIDLKPFRIAAAAAK